ncbi:hypothetical protein Cs7R123_73150 [Catellatospora sp. TT07R-123]|uniref:hypothetical protein n=1 Tax=Catellatospora sp. TT07R-123 TaxID=2733863 RepID=UPI001B226AA6|nr:hypothetical protein [Catellatospora sp. TT07R-123]GHJ49973.1 hypothetical protein Cs7R123_73150 [Catellatospora sp. TT07R-123]
MSDEFADDIPAEISALVHAAAPGASRIPAAGVAAVQRRGVQWRRRRAAATTAVLAGLVAVVTVVPVWTARAKGPDPAVSPRPSATAGPSASPSPRTLTGQSAQRMINSWQGAYESASNVDYDGPYTVKNFRDVTLPDAVVVFPDFGELSDSGVGQPLRYRDTLLTSVDTVLPTPSGGLALLGSRDLDPGHRRPDGPCVTKLEFRLELYDATGRRTLSRNVRRQCHDVALVGVDERYAYLRRDDLVVAHDLATGGEHQVVDLRKLPKPSEVGMSVPASVQSGRLVQSASDPLVGQADATAITVYDLADRRTYQLKLPENEAFILEVRLSPDGTRAAVVWRGMQRPFDLEVTVLDVATSAPLAHQVFKSTSRVPDASAGYATTYVGVAWHDASALRFAWYETPLTGKHLLSEMVRTDVITVP